MDSAQVTASLILLECSFAASEVGGEAAAALAAAYIALGRIDEGYLTAAEALYAWGVSTSRF